MSAVATPDVHAPSAPVASERPAPAARTRVLLVTEGTYPFHWGGVSTWCHALTHGLPEVDFTLVALARDPLAERRFELAPNVVDFRAIPLWGVRNAWELGPDRSLATARRRIRASGNEALSADFIPPLATVVREFLGASRDDVELAEAIQAIHRFLLEHDFDAAFRSRVVWDSFCAHVARTFPLAAARRGYPAAQASLADATVGMRWLYHWFFPLSQPLPRPDVVHTAMVGSCTLLAAALKLEHGTPFLLSEHGIYLRERYLAEHTSSANLFRKLLLLGFARRMTELSYALADIVSPCCDYNRRWELRNGARPELLETAYYGLEPRPSPAAAGPARGGPVVVWAGRIDPLKDLETLLRAAALVLEARPDVRFRLFGSAQPGREWYLRRCLALHRELALGESVRFEGFRDDTSDAIAEADLVVLSSISEGFPFTTLEAMLCGKPVVATAVGGICEQVPDSCGMTVEPRQPAAFAEAILAVLDDPDGYAQRSRAARERAESLFSAEQFRATHRSFYERLGHANGNGATSRMHLRVASRAGTGAPGAARAPAPPRGAGERARGQDPPTGRSARARGGDRVARDHRHRGARAVRSDELVRARGSGLRRRDGPPAASPPPSGPAPGDGQTRHSWPGRRSRARPVRARAAAHSPVHDPGIRRGGLGQRPPVRVEPRHDRERRRRRGLPRRDRTPRRALSRARISRSRGPAPDGCDCPRRGCDHDPRRSRLHTRLRGRRLRGGRASRLPRRARLVHRRRPGRRKALGRRRHRLGVRRSRDRARRRARDQAVRRDGHRGSAAPRAGRRRGRRPDRPGVGGPTGLRGSPSVAARCRPERRSCWRRCRTSPTWAPSWPSCSRCTSSAGWARGPSA